MRAIPFPPFLPSVYAMTIDPSIYSAFTPSGKLRASINLGNPILANLDPSGKPCGVSVDLATALAKVLGAELELVMFNAAGKSVEAVVAEQADVGFFAIDPIRGAEIAFTAPYVLIEGFYLVKAESPVQSNEDVDRVGNRIVVGKGSAYDLYLSRALKNAQILRSPTSPTVVETFLKEGAEVAAGVRQQLEADARRHGNLRLLNERFMVIQQAMGMPKSRGQKAADFLRRFVEDMKANGFVASALERHQIHGALVAPAVSELDTK